MVDVGAMSRDQTTIEHFHVHGWMRVHRAFDSDAAAAMRGVVWDGLADVGVLRDEPSTWTIERPSKLQKLKNHPAFAAVGSGRVLKAIDAILGTPVYEKPKRWGAIFIAFPSQKEWGVPASGGISTRTTRASSGRRRACRPTPSSATSRRAAARPRSCRARTG
jgi:hypothetical protein